MRIDKKKPFVHAFAFSASVILIAWSLLLSCSPTKQGTLARLQGHWHMDMPYQMTLDINNSSVEMNKYSLFETPEWFPLFDSATNDIVLPIPCGCGGGTFPYVDKFSFRSDMLIYNAKIAKQCYAYTPMKFIRGDLKTCQWKHTIQGNDINVKLATFPLTTSYVVDLDSLRRTSVVSYINVGVPERIDMFGFHPKIQVNGVFIEPPEIKQFLRSEKSRADDRPIVLCLNVDNAVSETFLEKVVSSIPRELVAAVYRLVTLDEKKYGYQKMQ